MPYIKKRLLTDCLVIEASTPHFNDRVRVESDYGLKEEPGLNSTDKNDIKTKQIFRKLLLEYMDYVYQLKE